MKISKKIYTIAILVILTFILSGCSDYVIPTSAKGGISDSFRTRVDSNISIVNELNAAGLMDDEAAELIIEGIRTNAETEKYPTVVKRQNAKEVNLK